MDRKHRGRHGQTCVVVKGVKATLRQQLLRNYCMIILRPKSAIGNDDG